MLRLDPRVASVGSSNRLLAVVFDKNIDLDVYTSVIPNRPVLCKWGIGGDGKAYKSSV